MGKWYPSANLPVFGLVLMGCSNPFAGSGSGHGAPKTDPRDGASITTPVEPVTPPATITVTTLPPVDTTDPVAEAIAQEVAAALAVDPDLEPDLATERFNEWRRARADQCLTVAQDERPNTEHEVALADIRERFLQAPLAQRLVASLSGTATTMCVPEAGDGEDIFDRPDQRALGFQLSNLRAVVMNQDLAQGRDVFVTAHELRHSWQAVHVPALAAGRLAPPHDATAVFVKEADANAFAVAIAWQLRQQGEPDTWQVARQSSSYGASARAFERAARAHHRANPGDSLTSDRAIKAGMRAAFQAWFEKDSLLEYYGNRVLEARAKHPDGWPGRNTLPADAAAQLGRLPGTSGDTLVSYLQPTDIALAAAMAAQIAPARVATSTPSPGASSATDRSTRPGTLTP